MNTKKQHIGGAVVKPIAANADQRFFLDQDGSCHWFIVPIEFAAKWAAWRNLDEGKPESWEVPDFAIPIGGGPQLVIFSNPILL